MSTNEDVINRITEIRKKNGLSINKLADKCGVNSANLSRSLAGKASLSDRVIYKIAHALNVSVDWLEKGVEPMLSPTVASPEGVSAAVVGSNINGSHSSNVSQSLGGDAALAAENKLLREQNEFLQNQVKTLLAIVGSK